MSKQQILTQHIENLCTAIPELNGVLLASADGLPIAHSLNEGADPTRIAAMAAAAANLGKRITNAISTGAVHEVSVRGSDGDVFVYSIADRAVLAVLSPQGGNAGLIHLEARSTAEEIGSLFT